MSQAASFGEPGRFDQESLKIAARRFRHPLARALLVLTFTTGLIDAVSYLGLGRVFAANMTGNRVLLGFGIAGSGGLPVVAPLVSLSAFLLGGVAGGILARKVGESTSLPCRPIPRDRGGLIALATIVAAAVAIRPRSVAADVVIAMLAFAMGVRNATVRRIDVRTAKHAVVAQRG